MAAETVVLFMFVYANYMDIFYHRSMEKDKLSILDVCGTYGQKDIERSDHSGPSLFSRVG